MPVRVQRFFLTRRFVVAFLVTLAILNYLHFPILSIKYMFQETPCSLNSFPRFTRHSLSDHASFLIRSAYAYQMFKALFISSY